MSQDCEQSGMEFLQCECDVILNSTVLVAWTDLILYMMLTEVHFVSAVLYVGRLLTMSCVKVASSLSISIYWSDNRQVKEKSLDNLTRLHIQGNKCYKNSNAV